MAATYEYSDPISCSHGLSWSKDQRIAFCTDTCIRVLSLTAHNDDISLTPALEQSYIPINETVWNIPELSDKTYRKLIKELPRGDLQMLTVDKILNPFKFLHHDLPLTGFSALSWSPLGGDDLGRSILATVTHDYRLCLFSQKASQFKWHQIADLTEIRHDQTQLESFSPTVSTFHQFVTWCYSQAVTAINWFPRLCEGSSSDEKYGVLAASVKSGDVVIWKINMPCTDSSDCSVLTVIKPHDGQPSSVCWSPYSDYLVITYVDGSVYGVQYDPCDSGKSPQIMCIWSDTDCMLVSSLVFLPPSQADSQYLLMTKESAFFLLRLSANLEVLSHSFLHGVNTLPVTDLCPISDSSYLAMSMDGKIQKAHLTFSSDGGKLSVTAMESSLPTETQWMYLFGCSSPNKAYIAFVFRPRPGYDHLDKKWKFPSRLHVCPISEEGLKNDSDRDNRITNFIHSCKGITQQSLDMVVAFKDKLLSQLNVEAFKGVNPDELLDMSPKVARFCLQLIITKMKTICNFKEMPELEQIYQTKEKRNWQITYKIIFLHVKDVVEKINTMTLGTLNDFESTSVKCMQTFVSEHEGDFGQEAAYSSTVAWLQEQSKGDNHVRCCICDAQMALSNTFQWTCSNGHSFGVCCKTLTPCDDVSYYTCSVCRVFCQSSNVLHGVRWLDGISNVCNVCDGILLL